MGKSGIFKIKYLRSVRLCLWLHFGGHLHHCLGVVFCRCCYSSCFSANIHPLRLMPSHFDSPAPVQPISGHSICSNFCPATLAALAIVRPLSPTSAAIRSLWPLFGRCSAIPLIGTSIGPLNDHYVSIDLRLWLCCLSGHCRHSVCIFHCCLRFPSLYPMLCFVFR